MVHERACHNTKFHDGEYLVLRILLPLDFCIMWEKPRFWAWWFSKVKILLRACVSVRDSAKLSLLPFLSSSLEFGFKGQTPVCAAS